MHLFDSDELKNTQSHFFISTVLIATVTYILAALAAWFIGKRTWGNVLRDGWLSFKVKLIQRREKSGDEES
jgi:hypothetical protein